MGIKATAISKVDQVSNALSTIFSQEGLFLFLRNKKKTPNQNLNKKKKPKPKPKQKKKPQDNQPKTKTQHTITPITFQKSRVWQISIVFTDFLPGKFPSLTFDALHIHSMQMPSISLVTDTLEAKKIRQESFLMSRIFNKTYSPTFIKQLK